MHTVKYREASFFFMHAPKYIQGGSFIHFVMFISICHAELVSAADRLAQNKIPKQVRDDGSGFGIHGS